METLLATYAVAWAAVVAFVILLAARNRQLNQRLERLEALLGKQQINELPRAKVA